MASSVPGFSMDFEQTLGGEEEEALGKYARGSTQGDDGSIERDLKIQ